MSAASARGRRDLLLTNKTRESADSLSPFNDSLDQFDPLAGYAEPKDTPQQAHDSPQLDKLQSIVAKSSSSFGVKSDRADSQIGETSRNSSQGMQRSNSSDMGRAGGARVARRESWHAGQTTSSPEEEPDLLRSSTSGSTARLRRRSTSAQTKYRAGAVQPPKLPELRESDDEFRHHVEVEKTSSLHHLPLVLVAVPSLGAILHGRAENWSDAIVLALVVFYLYNLIKIPWEMYYASYARTVLPAELSAAAASEAEAHDDPTLRAIRLTSAAQLKRAEVFSLSLTFLVPALGATLLYFARGMLSDPDRYINRFLIGLFALASSIKPIAHAVRLLKQNSLYHQEIVHYPSYEVVQLKKRLAQLETTAALRSTAESESSSRPAPDPTTPSVSPEQLDTLSRSFRRHTLAAAHFQTTTSARLDDLASTVSQLVEVIEAQEGEIVRLQQQQHHEMEAVERVTAPVLHRQRTSPYATGGIIKGVVRHLLLYLAYPPRQRRRDDRRRSSLLQRLVSAAAFVPVTAPKMAFGWAVEKSARGAVHLLGWEDGDSDQDEAEREADEDGEDGRQRRIGSNSGYKTKWPRGLPAPPSTSSIPQGSKPQLPGSFATSVSDSKQASSRVAPDYGLASVVEDSSLAPTNLEAEVATPDRSAPRRAGLGRTIAPSVLQPAGSAYARAALPVRAGGANAPYTTTRRTASSGGGGGGARLVSAH
ncbi:hypothetical protein JCM10908_005542 [Rhodotorula pacifica]|uniref:uncharacterized protein n=1 Tax=Rhodotorula pacifica TaxID=1495444 RepID=UPI00317826B8